MLKIDTKTVGGVEFVVLEGEIDMYVAPKVREALLAACQRCAKGVAVDLTSVPYMDSSGIATLIEGMQWTRKEGSRFFLVGVQQTVMDMLKLAKLHEFFDIYPTEEEVLGTLY